MVVRYFRVSIRRLARNRLLVLCILALQVMLVIGAFGPRWSWMDSVAGEVEMIREISTTQALESQPQPDYGEGEKADFYREQDRLQAQSGDRVVAAFDAGDVPELLDALADNMELSAEQSSSSYDGTLAGARIELYRALAEHGAQEVYAAPASMPATLYLISSERSVLQPLGGVLYATLPQTFFSDDGVAPDERAHASISTMLLGEQDYLIYLGVLVAVAASVARLQARRRLASQLPARPAFRLMMSSGVAALEGFAVLALIFAPVFVLQAVRNGVGDLSYPVIFGYGAYMLHLTVGEVLLRAAVLAALVSLVVSLAVHAAVAVFDRVWPGALVVVAAAATTLFPRYFMKFSPVGAQVAHLPQTYFRVLHTAGVYNVNPVERPLPQITFEAGCATLAVTALALVAVMLLACWLRYRRKERGLSGVVRASLGEAPGQDDGSASGEIAEAGEPTEAIAAPRHTELRPTGSRSIASQPAVSHHVAPRPVAPQHAARVAGAPFSAYAAALLRMTLSDPACYVLGLVMALAFAAPAAFPIQTDSQSYRQEQYLARGQSVGAFRELTVLLNSGAYAQDSQEYRQIVRQRELLAGFVYGTDRAGQFQSYADYWSYVLELSRVPRAVVVDATGPHAVEEFDWADKAPRIRTRIAMLEGLAGLGDDARVYDRTSDLPGFLYASFVASCFPFVWWLLPGAVVAATVCRCRMRGGLLQQVPASRALELGAAVLVAVPLSLVLLAVSVVPGTLLAVAGEGWGNAAYPVAFWAAGQAHAMPVGQALAVYAGTLVLVTVAVALAVITASAWARGVKAVYAAPVLLALLAGASAWCASVLPVLRYNPLAYLDVPSAFGAFGYAEPQLVGASAAVGLLLLGTLVAVPTAALCVSVRFGSRDGRAKKSCGGFSGKVINGGAPC